ncbi:HAD family phosphatase [Halomonas sp. PAMB 3264]|uniref:HAD family hydrolase n=1 Tax=Halomonas sp. PAMB 3264 TaxID=3075222 RepID=UPI00289F192F|nr:HAD family phosphatase [Halomonas sp. PAMB 3264]WNL41351.1 HAD family phosphatase [Halomonas sp. PAMB 3264]
MRAVIFDCDGVLVDSEILAEHTLQTHLQAWLPDVDVAAELNQALGMTTANIIAHLQTLSRHTLPDNAVDQVDAAIKARLSRELRAIEGASEAITACLHVTAVVSNSHRRRVEASLAATGLDRVLDGALIVTAEQVANPKPAPDLYLLAARKLELPPQACLAVEDSVAGVRAAVAAGLTVVGFVGASHLDERQAERLRDAGAWRVIASFDELGALVASWSDDAMTANSSL